MFTEIHFFLEIHFSFPIKDMLLLYHKWHTRIPFCLFYYISHQFFLKYFWKNFLHSYSMVTRTFLKFFCNFADFVPLYLLFSHVVDKNAFLETDYCCGLLLNYSPIICFINVHGMDLNSPESCLFWLFAFSKIETSLFTLFFFRIIGHHNLSTAYYFCIYMNTS